MVRHRTAEAGASCRPPTWSLWTNPSGCRLRALIVGLGVVGSRCARQLLSSNVLDELIVLSRDPSRAGPQLAALGGAGAVRAQELTRSTLAAEARGTSVVLFTCPGPVAEWAEMALEAGAGVVSANDGTNEARSLLRLDARARAQGLPVAVGAAVAPGLSCLLAWWAASQMDELTEVHVATFGTGGPWCARRRHSALREPVEEWRDGAWERRVAGSGRELVWFPAHVGADCYRLNRPDPLLLTLAFPGLRVATARAAATRRDRFTSWLPMLRPPHPEGTVGGLRVEARGRKAGAAESVIVGASGRPGLVAGTVAAAAALRALSGGLRAGAGGLASLAKDPAALLADLVERGTLLMAFEGAALTPAW